MSEVRYMLPAGHRCASACMLQPIRRSSQTGRAGWTGRERQQGGDVDVLWLPAHIQMYAEDVSSHEHVHHPSVVSTHLFLSAFMWCRAKVSFAFLSQGELMEQSYGLTVTPKVVSSLSNNTLTVCAPWKGQLIYRYSSLSCTWQMCMFFSPNSIAPTV